MAVGSVFKVTAVQALQGTAASCSTAWLLSLAPCGLQEPDYEPPATALPPPFDWKADQAVRASEPARPAPQQQLQAPALQQQQAIPQQLQAIPQQLQAMPQQLQGQHVRGGGSAGKPAPAPQAPPAQAFQQQAPGFGGSSEGPGPAVRAPAPAPAPGVAAGLAQRGLLLRPRQTGFSSGPASGQQHQPGVTPRPAAPNPAGPWPAVQGMQAVRPHPQQQLRPYPLQQQAAAGGPFAGHPLATGMPQQQAPAPASLPLAPRPGPAGGPQLGVPTAPGAGGMMPAFGTSMRQPPPPPRQRLAAGQEVAGVPGIPQAVEEPELQIPLTGFGVLPASAQLPRPAAAPQDWGQWNQGSREVPRPQQDDADRRPGFSHRRVCDFWGKPGVSAGGASSDLQGMQHRTACLRGLQWLSALPQGMQLLADVSM